MKINHRSKCKWNKIGEHLGNFGFGDEFSDKTPKTCNELKKIVNWTPLKSFALHKTILRKIKDHSLGENFCKLI